MGWWFISMYFVLSIIVALFLVCLFDPAMCFVAEVDTGFINLRSNSKLVLNGIGKRTGILQYLVSFLLIL